MNIVSAGAIHYLTGIDVKYSPCGRELGFLGQLASLGEQCPTLGKVISVALLCFASLMMMSSIYLISTDTYSTVSSLSLVSELGDELVLMVLKTLPAVIATLCLLNLVKAFSLQEQESQLINDLGGPGAFNHLPVIHDIEDEKDLRHLEPSDVRHRTITRGFLPDRRVFIAFQIQEKPPHQQPPAMTILCQTKWSILKPLVDCEWQVLGHQKSAIGRGNAHQKLLNIWHLINRTHHTHELV